VGTWRLGACPRDFPRLVPAGFSPFPHGGHENPEADTHVESYDDGLSDAGSTPAASTTRTSCVWWEPPVVRQVSFGLSASLDRLNSPTIRSFFAALVVVLSGGR